MMPTRKNKILTMLFGLLPGAGHMFMGFMHLGVSYMTLFFGGIALVLFLNEVLYIFGYIGFVLPVIWCYAFFDCLNKCYASDEEFYTLEDHFLFTDNNALPNFTHNFNFHLNRYVRLAVGWLLTIFGSLTLARNILRSLEDYGLLSWESPLYRMLRGVLSDIPQFLAAVAIILIGLRLIFGKRRELKELKSLIEPDIMENIQDLEEVEHHE